MFYKIRKRQGSLIQNIDLSGNKLKCVPFKFLKSVKRCYALFLESNCFVHIEDYFPEKTSLRKMCFSFYNPVFVKRDYFYCDVCDVGFGYDPIKVYTRAKLDGENLVTIENEVCSRKCYRVVIRFGLDDFVLERWY
jgi:hypothetical protein